MLRIVFISRGWWPNVRGGSERFVYRVSLELFKRGHELIGIYYRFPNGEEAEAPFKLLVGGSGDYNYLKALMFSYNAAKKAIELRPDVVLVNGYWSESSPIFIGKRLRIIYLLHDLGFMVSKGLIARIKGLILRYSIKSSNIVVVPTEFVKNELILKLGVEEGKVRVIGFEGIDSPLRYVHRKNNFFDIVQVGRYSPSKGHLILLNAFKEIIKELDNARLWLVGSSDPKGSEYLSKVIEAAKGINAKAGKEVVKVIINTRNVTQYYELADVCVAPSVSAEGFGLFVAECMGYGKPVIASDLFKETGVVNEDSALIVPRGDVKALAEALKKLARDDDLKSRLSENGLRRAMKFRWERVADFLENVINEVINQ